MTGPGYGGGPPGPQYGHPGGYGGAGWPGAPGQQPYGQPPYGTPQPYGPYPGQGYPPGPGGYGGRAARPPTVWVGVALLILSAVPFLAGGVYVLIESFRTVPTSNVAGEFFLSELAGGAAGAARATSVLIGIYALAYIVLAVVAATGKSWARTMLAVLTGLWGMPLLGLVALFAYFLPNSAATSAEWLVALGVPIGVLLASIGGMVVLYLPANRPFYATPRR